VSPAPWRPRGVARRWVKSGFLPLWPGRGGVAGVSHGEHPANGRLSGFARESSSSAGRIMPGGGKISPPARHSHSRNSGVMPGRWRFPSIGPALSGPVAGIPRTRRPAMQRPQPACAFPVHPPAAGRAGGHRARWRAPGARRWRLALRACSRLLRACQVPRVKSFSRPKRFPPGPWRVCPGGGGRPTFTRPP